MVREAGIYNDISPAYAGLDSSRFVAVMGDKREYGNVVILRAVKTSDFITAEAYESNWLLPKKITGSTDNEVQGVSRVM
ncbi:hypothetical protein DL769_000906 [Monosporascus sp. CRB-8-3]|nr:hypothetical protein DL769_000906 [Monosporascus sp. CRB-8-3]